jgi:hypothetical protein
MLEPTAQQRKLEFQIGLNKVSLRKHEIHSVLKRIVSGVSYPGYLRRAPVHIRQGIAVVPDRHSARLRHYL